MSLHLWDSNEIPTPHSLTNESSTIEPADAETFHRNYDAGLRYGTDALGNIAVIRTATTSEALALHAAVHFEPVSEIDQEFDRLKLE